MPLARTLASRALAACGTLLILAAAVAWTTGGLAFAIGALRVSATDPARLLMEGAVALVAWAIVFLEHATHRRTLIVTGLLMTYYFALVAESTPRRVGDGHEYIAMARQLSALAPPSLSQAQIDAITGEMAALPGYGSVTLRTSNLVGPDGRQEFVHFWLYPLIVAPVLSLVRAVGAHWNHAFTIVNLLLLGGFAYCAAARLRPDAAILLACGPVIWWIDKAHVEVFNYALVGTALVLLDTAPHITLVLFGLVAAQNPAFAILLGTVTAVLIWRTHGVERRRIAIAAGVAALIVSVHPAYYLWRLGIVTPLFGAVGREWPGLTAIVTPLVDPDLGLFWWFPALAAAIVIAATAKKTRVRDPLVGAAVAASAAGLLVIVAMSGNINHGATPGLSRYGLWLSPLAVVLLAGGNLSGWRGVALPVIAVGSMAQMSWTSHPKILENSLAPSSLSIWLTDHAPRLYDPVPEVFGERYAGVDGAVPLPVASRDCGKILLPNPGRAKVRWPIPCTPAQIPEACRSRDLCYANREGDGYVFDATPRQPSFGFVVDGEPDLLWTGPNDFNWLPVRVAWSRMAFVQPLGSTSPIRTSTYVNRIVAFQNQRDFVAFITTARPWLGQPRLLLAASRPGDEFWWLDLDRKLTVSHQPIGGEIWVDMPSPGARLLIVRRRTETR